MAGDIQCFISDYFQSTPNTVHSSCPFEGELTDGWIVHTRGLQQTPWPRPGEKVDKITHIIAGLRTLFDMETWRLFVSDSCSHSWRRCGGGMSVSVSPVFGAQTDREVGAC